MKYRLQRQEINQKLIELASKKIKENKIKVPKAPIKTLKEIRAIMDEIQKHGLPKYLVRKKLKKKLGYGIFLHPDAKPILKGESIAPYSGRVFVFPQNQVDTTDYAFALISDLRLTREEQREWDPKSRYHPRRLYSIDLDAEKTGNFTRFINHSTKPNIEAEFLRIPRNSLGLSPAPFELIYVAKKTIHPGEQLLISYEPEGNNYWGVLNIKPFPMTPKTFQLNSSFQLTT